MINWRVRIKNKMFWLAVIPAALLFIQTVCNLFGIVIDVGHIGNKLIEVVNALFALLAVLGIVVDPTTAGVSDSQLAMTYDKPKDDAERGNHG